MSDKIFIECKICGCAFLSNNSLGKHIKRTHHIETKEYYDKFLKKPNEGFCKECNNPTRYWSLTRGYLSYCSNYCVTHSKEVYLKVEKTNLERYGVKATTQNKDVLNKRKENNLKKYGVEYTSQLESVKENNKKTCLEKYGVTNVSKINEIKEKKAETCFNHYGVTVYTQTDEYKKRYKEICLEKYGVENVSQADEIKYKKEQTILKNYGVTNPNYSKEIQSYKAKRYCYNNIMFDSSWELGYYIWLKDNNIEFEYHPDISFEYIKDNKIHRYYPDFKVNNELQEIKGTQFFDNNGQLIDPYSKKLLSEKYKCILDNNIKIIKENDIKPILEYVFEKYGRKYLKQFKVK